MNNSIKQILFDRQDYELLNIVNDVLGSGEKRRHLKNLLGSYLHPHGIVEMAAPSQLRMAYSIIHLLNSLDAGKAGDRTLALRILNLEVMCSGGSSFRFNTARVLLQIMKELVRNRNNYKRQLELAHDFRAAASGKRRIVRQQLHLYHLLEMPEEWNQLCFDDHVHDSNTKGRKSPTHLIMDAWIKGIRFLTVVYYNYVSHEAVAELMEAAQIMNINVRIGIEFSVKFRSRYIQLIWSVRGLSDAQEYLSLLSKEDVCAFMEESRKVSLYQQRHVLVILREFNEKHRAVINEKLGIDLLAIDEKLFLNFVGSGQASLLHLANYVHLCMQSEMKKRVEALRKNCDSDSSPESYASASELTDMMNQIDPDFIYENYLTPDNNPSVPNPVDASKAGPDIPYLLSLSPADLIQKLNSLHHGSRITLNLKNLNVEDVLEILYDCSGHITHLEIFNLKDFAGGRGSHYEKINELQVALNDGNVILLNRMLRMMIDRMKQEGRMETAGRISKILHNIAVLKELYREIPLKSCAGTDSIGRSRRNFGMGLAVKSTLPVRAQKEFKKNHLPGQKVPIIVNACFRITILPRIYSNMIANFFLKMIHFLPGTALIGQRYHQDWQVRYDSIRLAPAGNIITLGGISGAWDNGLRLTPNIKNKKGIKFSSKYMNSGLKNGLKILAGFIPAFLTFMLTKDWWLLAYLGAFIWFGITGLRNILQSVMGGGGFRRSPLLRWKDYVSWDRLSDSLLYTGFSVPLLDYLVKTLLLDQCFNINTTTSSSTLYIVMALTNGLYLSTHNLVRGLPKGAVFGNFFRSILSIPVAILFNAVISSLLGGANVPGTNEALQKWAAVISKTASDCVAGIIEGISDRYENISLRKLDFDQKISQLRDSFTQLAMIFPETDLPTLFETPEKIISILGNRTEKLLEIIIINSLDLLYFWMYQPRARDVFKQIAMTMSEDERRILVGSQSILMQQSAISRMFVDGLIGKNFSKGLSFYLARADKYLKEISRMTDIDTKQREDATGSPEIILY